MSTKLQAVRGMNDILPAEIALWRIVENAILRVTRAYGYKEIRPPIVERTTLFKRGIGEATDIVEKEMYTFNDTGDESLTLRPEATASCVRAGIEHGLLHNQTQRWWYQGPMFRRERPQKGRYRQFHQFGIEALGWAGPDIDAELMLVGRRLWHELNITDVRLEINTLGSQASRARYRNELVSFFNDNKQSLDEDSLRRLQTNPLRILDSKIEATRQLVCSAPSLLDFIDTQESEHFQNLQQRLDDAAIVYRVNPLLVRGLDYYTGTVFEWVTDKLGAQNAVCAGGRYDGLVEQLGGRATPAAGFAMGLERLIALLKNGGADATDTDIDVYFALLGSQAERVGMELAEKLRDEGVNALLNCGGGSLKRQLKRAHDSGASIALVLGDDELANNEISLKLLRQETPQQRVAQSDSVKTLMKLLSDDSSAV